MDTSKGQVHVMKRSFIFYSQQIVGKRRKNAVSTSTFAKCFRKLIEDLLQSGTTVICDRYAYSGVAYSVGAQGLDIQWCMESDRGLPRPDIVFNLIVDPENCFKRSDYGTEIYDEQQIARNVINAYDSFAKADNWHQIKIKQAATPEMSIEIVAVDVRNSFLALYESLPHTNFQVMICLECLGNKSPW